MNFDKIARNGNHLINKEVVGKLNAIDNFRNGSPKRKEVLIFERTCL